MSGWLSLLVLVRAICCSMTGKDAQAIVTAIAFAAFWIGDRIEGGRK